MMKAKIVSTVPRSRFELFKVEIPDQWEVDFVDYPLPEEALIEALRDADFLLVGSVHHVSSAVIHAAPSLKMIHTEGVGFDKVDVEAARAVGLPVCNNRAVNNVSVAEHTIGLILAALKRMVYSDREIKRGDFTAVQTQLRTEGIHELRHQHVGLVGCGAIGQEVARMLGVFGCKVSYFDTYRPSPERERALNISYLELDDLLAQCDIVSLHVPVLPDTVNIINARALGLMKDHAILVNTSRGELIDQPAAASALESGRLGALAIDTLAPEPPAEDHPFLTLTPDAADRLIITPHVAGTTAEAFTRMLQWVIADFQEILAGRLPDRVCNGVTELR
jgi:phosphoglycerate dehydrogenase-like enzyme